MGLKQRQERDREAVSRSILDAARELFVTHGYQEVSIRKIAEKIEYSPAAIYSYFPSKDDIFFALAEEGFRLLFSYGASPRAADADAADDPDDPIGAIRAMFWRYYEFSKEHPEYFALMFLDRSVPRISKNWNRFGFVSEGSTLMVARIQQAIGSGAFPAGTEPNAVFRVLLTSIHGAATMKLCDRLAAGENADALARITLDTALMGLRAGSGVTKDLSFTCTHIDSEERQS
ncbi:MAG TPA: TetR/AcrR family transcriptional regulator [Vicinamibacterales bacterium]